jgi:hypothetical protein
MSSSDISAQDAKVAIKSDDPANGEKSGLPNARPLRFDRTQEDLPVLGNRNGEPEGNTARDGAFLFKKLVTSDDDLVGLVAYGLYKQNKYEWLGAFENSCGRRPSADESRAYVLGEGTPRRIATYRQLAEGLLAARTLHGAEPRSMAELRSVASLPERDSVREEAPRPPTRRSADGSAADSASKNRRISLYYFIFMCVLAGVCVWLLAVLGVLKI